MEAIWKWAAKTVNARLIKYETKRRVNGICNRLDGLSGELATHVDVLGTGLVQRFNDITGKQLSDMGVIIREIVEDAISRKVDYHTMSDKIIQAVGGHFVNVEERIVGIESEFCRLSDKARIRHDVTIQGQDELARQASLFDQANGDRMLTLLDHLRDVKTAIDLTQGMQIRFFENTTQQLTNHFNSIRVPHDKQRHDVAPHLHWVFDNVDDIIGLGDGLKALRDNDAPQGVAKMEVIRRVRQLNLWSISNVRDEVERLIRGWGNDTPFCQAA